MTRWKIIRTRRFRRPSAPLVPPSTGAEQRNSDLDWSIGAGEIYWDPVPWIERLSGVQVPGYSFRLPPSQHVFGGKWAERNWRNVPGPIYGAMTDNCWTGRLHAPHHVLYGDDIDYEQEFLYRQPRTLDELSKVVVAAGEDPWLGWACDGDEHWSPTLVREWWRDRARVKAWIDRKIGQWQYERAPEAIDAVAGLHDYADYIEGELEGHLRAYVFWLEESRPPVPENCLPDL